MASKVGTKFRARYTVPESDIQLSIEDDPTPMVLSIRSDLVRRLADPAYAELPAAIRGRATIRAPATPEAVKATAAETPPVAEAAG